MSSALLFCAKLHIPYSLAKVVLYNPFVLP